MEAGYHGAAMQPRRLPVRSRNIDEYTGRVLHPLGITGDLSHHGVAQRGVVNVGLNDHRGPLLAARTGDVRDPRQDDVSSMDGHASGSSTAMSSASMASTSPAKRSISSSVQGLS